MTVLNWDKPEKAKSTEEWKSHSFDGGPPGAYIPNMSKKDQLKWRAKYVGGKRPRVEIRKSTTNGTQIVIVVTRYGFPPKGGNGDIEPRSEGKNVRMSQNGPAFFTMVEFQEFSNAVEEAWEKLQAEAQKN